MDSNLITYIIVFLVVFVPYVFLQFCLDSRRRRQDDRNMEAIPPLFRWCFGLLCMLSENGGKQLASLQPERAKTIKNKLIIASIPMGEEVVFAAETLFGIAGTVLPLLFFMVVTKRMDFAICSAILFGLIGFIYPSMTVSSLAEKRQVIDMTRRLLHLSAPPKPDDAADAVALAICHARSVTSLLAEKGGAACSTI